MKTDDLTNGFRVSTGDYTMAVAQTIPTAIEFRSDLGKSIGRLKWNDVGELTFEGNADDAAMCLFRNVIGIHSARIKELESKVDAARRCLSEIANESFWTDHSSRAQSCLDHM